MRPFRFVPLLAVLAAFAQPSEASTIALSFTAEPVNGFADGGSRMLGWQFTVGAAPITVTALGFHDYNADGLLVAHEVGIWKTDQTLLASTTVQAGTASTLVNFFRFESIAPLVLSAGSTYVIAGYDNGADKHVWDVFLPGYSSEVTGFSADSAITLGAAGSAFGPGQASFGFPLFPIGGSDTRHALMGPNFLFGDADVAAVPEPATLLLLGAGLVGARLRRRTPKR